MREQEERFIEINKLPNEVQESVLEALCIDIGLEACVDYQPAKH